MADRIIGGLYLSSYDEFIREGDIAEKYGISHIVSVFKGSLPSDYYDRFQVKSIEVDDEESTNIIQYFDEANDFINKALFPTEETFQRGIKAAHKSSVIILCQAGESRSPTILASFLMKKYNLTVEQAFHAIQRKREKNIRPNESFKEQLELYFDLDCQVDTTDPLYRKWNLQHAIMLDPTGKSLLTDEQIFQEESARLEELQDKDKNLTHLRCKRCRHPLATAAKFIYHLPPSEESKHSKFIRRVPNKRKIIKIESAAPNCSHVFIEPIPWMKDELFKGEVEGKFSCPKCSGKIGAYSWKGSRCSCGKWMVPALHLQRAKVDEVKKITLLNANRNTQT